MSTDFVSLCVVIPAFNESSTIAGVVTAVSRVLASIGCTPEIVVVDDGSTDGTYLLAERAGAHVLRHPRNKGYGASLKTGIRHATHDTIVILDADGQHDPDDILKLLAYRHTAEMVVGARNGTAGSPLWRKPGKKIIGWLANQLTRRNIPDLNSGFRAIDRKLITKFLPIMPDGFSFSTTSTIALLHSGHEVVYVPIDIKSRKSKSTVTVKDGFNTILLIFRLVTLFAPFRICLPISFFVALLGVFYVVNGYITTGTASIRGILSLLASILFFLFGLLLDQVSAMRRGEIVQSSQM